MSNDHNSNMNSGDQLSLLHPPLTSSAPGCWWGSSHTLNTILSFCNKNGSNGKTQQPANYLKKHKRERDDQGNQDERRTKEIMKKPKPKQKEPNQGNTEREREREREHGKLQARDILRNN
jgi:hypothetical protein